MGTLFNQPVRDTLKVCLEDAYERQKDVQRLIPCGEDNPQTGIEIAVHLLVLELSRANDLAVIDGDIRDEQIAGIGELMQEIISEMGYHNDSLKGIKEELNESLIDIRRHLLALVYKE